MPFEAVAFTQIQATDALTKEDLTNRIEKLYDNSAEFISGAQAVTDITSMLENGDTMYLGMFNDKPIASVMALRENDSTTKINFIVIHQANRGRGLAGRLLEMVCEQEESKGVTTFVPGCPAIAKNLAKLGK